MFTVQLTLGEQVWEAEGTSIKKAQHSTAAKALVESVLPRPAPRSPKVDINSNPGSTSCMSNHVSHLSRSIIAHMIWDSQSLKTHGFDVSMNHHDASSVQFLRQDAFEFLSTVHLKLLFSIYVTVIFSCLFPWLSNVMEPSRHADMASKDIIHSVVFLVFFQHWMQVTDSVQFVIVSLFVWVCRQYNAHSGAQRSGYETRGAGHLQALGSQAHSQLQSKLQLQRDVQPKVSWWRSMHPYTHVSSSQRRRVLSPCEDDRMRDLWYRRQIVSLIFHHFLWQITE